ncbi:nickel insertion protein [Ammoniphilus sp. 3BR4]|uniref:nickel insertion protein n=1 Tax=Ammoniphilus sp. 3BR4 TaxID=3158265 RepID=UPI003465DF87
MTVLCNFQDTTNCEAILLHETTTIGVRKSTWTRRILNRRFITVETSFGDIRVKQAIRENEILHQAPEFEDVSMAAKQHGIPFKELHNIVLKMLINQDKKCTITVRRIKIYWGKLG